MEKKLVLLQTNLFPDVHRLEAALAELDSQGIRRFDLTLPDIETADWARVLDALLAADHVITI